MSRTLALISATLASVRALAKQGRRCDALKQATLLLERTDLPDEVAFDANRLAGELAIDLEKFTKARQHLRAAENLQPTDAKTQYLLGIAHEHDPQGDDRRAAVRYRRASILEPNNAHYAACLGRALVRCGKAKHGVRILLASAKVSTSDVAVIRVLVDGLVEAGRVDAARKVVVKARFLNPNNRELASLWDRVRFEAARTKQGTRTRQDAQFAMDGALNTLPFIRLVGTPPQRTADGGTIRMDRVSHARPHFPRMLGLKAES